MQPIKLKEVWRNPDGSFAKAPEPEIKKVEPKKETGNALIGVCLLLSVLALAAVMFWQVTVTVAAVTGARYASLKFNKGVEPKLIINHYC